MTACRALHEAQPKHSVELADLVCAAIVHLHNPRCACTVTAAVCCGLQVTAYNHASKTTEYLTAKYVLSTLPLGVLKASYTTLFAADGPNSVDSQKAARKVAIDSLGMGLLNKVGWQPVVLGLVQD